jgi:hypothetical protein
MNIPHLDYIQGLHDNTIPELLYMLGLMIIPPLNYMQEHHEKKNTVTELHVATT